ncbi:enolase-phosphatase E1-like isoform X2 [Cucurbita maxima]|uniref:Enolase-phosphatase E1-like isoform X2 n=1 Tax=Cucurbita maxima TaxID=3661 RepID=A0A6J1IS09_CUCMA|nr:enolase-phosphatase E1-like isoform X2 [Cucurbita maxima]
MGCGESKLAVSTTDGVLLRKKSSARSKNGSKAAVAVVDDVKVASVKKTEKMINEEKIDGSVKIESEKNTEKREEKKSDAEKIVGTVKFESEEKSDGVVAEVQNPATEVAKTEEIKEKEVTCDGEKKEKEDGNNGGAIEKQVAGETKAEKEKEKEAIVSGSPIEVAQGTKPVEEQQLAGEVEQGNKPVEKKQVVGEVEQVIKPVEEKPLIGQVEQIIKTVDEKQLPIETKTEKNESGDNGGSAIIEQVIKPVEEKQLAEEPKVEKQTGEAVKLKEETQAKKEEPAPKVEQTQISATPDAKGNASELAVKDSK